MRFCGRAAAPGDCPDPRLVTTGEAPEGQAVPAGESDRCKIEIRVALSVSSGSPEG